MAFGAAALSGGVPLEMQPNKKGRKKKGKKTALCAFASQMFVIRFRLHRLNCLSAGGYITADVGSNQVPNT